MRILNGLPSTRHDSLPRAVNPSPSVLSQPVTDPLHPPGEPALSRQHPGRRRRPDRAHRLWLPALQLSRRGQLRVGALQAHQGASGGDGLQQRRPPIGDVRLLQGGWLGGWVRRSEGRGERTNGGGRIGFINAGPASGGLQHSKRRATTACAPSHTGTHPARSPVLSNPTQQPHVSVISRPQCATATFWYNHRCG